MAATQASTRTVLDAVSPLFIVGDLPRALEFYTLAAEDVGRGAAFSKPLADTEDGLRGFEIADRDGYILFFGCPL